MNLDKAIALMPKLPIRDFATQRLVPFKLYESQKRVLAAIKKQNDANQPIRVIVLKSRRQGISTLIDTLFTFHCMSRPGVNALIVTHNFKSSKELFKCPRTLVTDKVEGSRSLTSALNLPAPTQHMITFPHTADNSFLSIATAGNVEGGRGMYLTDCHLSELAFYQSENTFAALLPTVPNQPDTMIVIESTANGRVGIGQSFFDFWNNSMRGETSFTPVFLSWLEDPNNINFNLNVDDAPIDDEEKRLMKDGVICNNVLIKASKEQIAWRRQMIASPVCRGYVDIFDQEYPDTPEHAFISTGEPAFTKDEMNTARSEISKGTPSEIGMDGDRLYCETRATSPLLIWEPPIEGHRYYFGVDSARGLDTGDFAAVVGFDGETGSQVMRYESRVDPEYLARFCMMLGMYYNKGMLCIELTGNLGLWVQVRLRDHYHYPNLYRWRGTRDDKSRPGGSRGGSLGWETTYRSRERAMISFREAVLHRLITIRDEEIVRQMDLCTRKDAWTRWEIEYGHDDVLMATMLANISRQEWHPRAATSSLPGQRDESAVEKFHAQPTIEHIGTVTAQAFDDLIKQRNQWVDSTNNRRF